MPSATKLKQDKPTDIKGFFKNNRTDIGNFFRKGDERGATEGGGKRLKEKG
jgi:hypothetical protein